MTRGFTNEEQTAFLNKLKANFTREELRLLPQMFEVWLEENDYYLRNYYEATEVFNMGIDWPTFVSYNHTMALYMTDEELQQLAEARQREMDFLTQDNPTEESVDGVHPTEDLPY